jgi:hypothetical protein
MANNLSQNSAMDRDYSRPERAMDHDYTHPERHYNGLIFAPNGETPHEVRPQRRGLISLPDPHVELCWSCGWSSYNQLASSYGSRIRIFHTRDNTGLWAIGSQWLIRDQPNDSTLGNDYITQQFLRNQPSLNIPLVKEMRRLSEPTDQIQFTLMSRAQGVPLDLIWQTLSLEQKSSYKDQLANSLKQLRRFTALGAQKVDGSPLDDVMIGHCFRRHPPTCKKIGYTTDEWFENLAEDLRRGLSKIHKTKDPTMIEEKLQELKDNFPKGDPYVLTHGDLNLSNIIVKDDKIEAIIDWEMSGYFPWWAERWLSLVGGRDGSDELFDPLWADICPEMDEDTFREKVFSKVTPVILAWGACRTEHPDNRTSWLRPAFCECKPYAGWIKWEDIGNQIEHKIKDDDLEREKIHGPWGPSIEDMIKMFKLEFPLAPGELPPTIRSKYSDSNILPLKKPPK